MELTRLDLRRLYGAFIVGFLLASFFVTGPYIHVAAQDDSKTDMFKSFDKYENNPLEIPAYNANGVVHPDVLYFPSGMDGYNYWMVYTPFPPDSEENPSIIRSTDGATWTDLEIANPVIARPQEVSFQCDPDMLYVPEYSKWFMIFARYFSDNTMKICLAYSTNGVDWIEYDGTPVNGNTNPAIIYSGDNCSQEWELEGNTALSDATFLYENGSFHLFYAGGLTVNNEQKVAYATFTWNNTTNDIENCLRYPGNPVLYPSQDSTFNAGCGHLDIAHYNGTYYLYAVRTLLGTTNYELALFTSTDKTSWTNQGMVLQGGSPGSWDDMHIYRSSLVTDGIGNAILFSGKVKLYYSAYKSSTGCPSIGMATSARACETGWWDFGWQYRKLMTINHTKVEAPLSDFPVMIDLKASDFDFDKCKHSLEDIRFTDYNGSPLQYELENTLSSSSYRYWTRVPLDNTFAYTDGAHNIVPYDIDVDGNVELVTCSYRADSLQFYKYYGDPKLSSSWTRCVIDNNVGGGTGGSGAHYIAIADLNGDGRMDLVLAEDQQQEDVVAYLAPVDRLNMSAWEKHVLFDDDTVGVYHCEVGDIDGDGDPDVSMATRSTGNVGWLENTGALDNWPAYWIDEAVRDPFNARIGDLDHDGTGEIISTYASTSTTDGYYTWYDCSGDPRNQANWVKHTMADVGTGSVIGPCTMQIVDMDGDGNLDVVGYNYDQYAIYIFENPYPGDMTVEWPKYKVSNQYFSRDSGIGDLDGDGDLDIAGSDQDKDMIYWLENPGNPFTVDWKDHAIDTSNSYLDWAHCAAVSDIDRDGDLDVAAAAANGNTFQWYANDWHEPEKEAVAWVKLPSISNVSDTQFYMYYGNPSAADAQDPAGVWDSGFKLVQHLKETSGTCYDSTANHNDGTPYGDLNQGVVGKIDGAAEFDGANDYVEMSSDAGLPSGPSDRTLSVWVKIDAFNNGRIFSYGQWSADRAFDLIANQNNQFWIVGHTNNYHTVKNDFQTGVWYNIVAVLEGGQLTFYWNGIKDSTQATTLGTVVNNDIFTVGRSTPASPRETAQHFDGVIDDVQFSSVAKSESWVFTSYENQNSPSTFYTFEPEETLGEKPTLEMSPLTKLCRKHNETFSIEINVTNAYNVEDFEFEIRYNATILDVAGLSWNEWGSGTTTSDDGKITGHTSGSPMSGNATLVTIAFRAAAYHVWKDEGSVPSWTNNLTGAVFIQWANLSYAGKEDLGYVRGVLYEINVGADFAYKFAPIQGDVNNDGTVDIFDLRTVSAYYACKEGDLLWPAASVYDLKGNSIIDVFDMVIVAMNYGYECTT